MKHSMLVQLQLLVRDSPPPDPELGAIYYDRTLSAAQVWDGVQWTGLSGGREEVLIQSNEPISVEGVDLWVDYDDELIGGNSVGGAVQYLTRNYVDEQVNFLRDEIDSLRTEIGMLKEGRSR